MKILIISTNPSSNNTNIGKTIYSLFHNFNKEDLCQLYFSKKTPNISLCSEYYQICEAHIVKELIHVKKSGKLVEPVESNKMPKSNTFGKKKLLKFSGVWLLREIIWSLGTWKRKSLKEFILRNDFDLVFFVMPEFNYPIHVLEYIMKIKKIPTVLYVTDNYYDYPQNRSPIRQWINERHKKKINNLKKYMSGVIGCSEEASCFFSDLYGVPAITAYVPNETHEILKKENEVVTFRYFGNLGLNRWKVLQRLGIEIAKINQEKGQNAAILEVYSNTLNEEIINALTIENGCIYKGWTSGEEYVKLLSEADVAVHVESFSEDMISRTKWSLSTKISEYVPFGKCIFAIGSPRVSSIKYLGKCAEVAFDVEQIEASVMKLITQKEYRMELEKKAMKLAEQNHNLEKNNRHLEMFLQKTAEEKGK